VQTCLQEVIEQLNSLYLSLSSSTSDLMTRNSRIDIAKSYFRTQSFLRDMDDLSDSLRSQTFPETFKEDIPGEMYKSFQSATAAVFRLCKTENRDLIPSLARFARDWSIAIPLDPAIPSLPDFVTVRVFQRDYEFSLTYGHADTELKVELRIRPGASQEIVLEQVKTILQMYDSWNVDPKARRTRLRPKRAHYEKTFEAYDLDQQGSSREEIARQLWPKEFERDQRPYPARNPTEQRVHDAITRAQELIHGVKK
jgi:hypothetical protein